ncbi:E5b protein, partial [Omikronpapillomavirus 1]
ICLSSSVLFCVHLCISLYIHLFVHSPVKSFFIYC